MFSNTAEDICGWIMWEDVEENVGTVPRVCNYASSSVRLHLGTTVLNATDHANMKTFHRYCVYHGYHHSPVC